MENKPLTVESLKEALDELAKLKDGGTPVPLNGTAYALFHDPTTDELIEMTICPTTSATSSKPR